MGLPRAPRKLLAADFNADQRDDIAAVTWGTETISILLNTSAGLPAQQIEDFGGTPKENTVILRWSTPSEAQNAGFGVERRTEPTGTWSAIGSVVGAGTSEVEQLYAFDDLEPPAAGEVDYRLRQVDFDGGVQLTAPVTVVVPEPGATLCMLAALGALSALARRSRRGDASISR